MGDWRHRACRAPGPSRRSSLGSKRQQISNANTERDDERRVRIANEVRAEKWAKDAEDMKRRHGGKVPV